MNVNELEQYLRFKGCKLKGCSRFAVRRIENHFGIKLPAVYKQFLYLMGKDAGAFMKGSSAFYSEIYLLRDDLDAILRDNGMSFPENAFVFWAHQGYQFAFFYVDAGDNPPVYFYYCGRSKEFEKKEDMLTAFWEKQLMASGLMEEQ